VQIAVLLLGSLLSAYAGAPGPARKRRTAGLLPRTPGGTGAHPGAGLLENTLLMEQDGIIERERLAPPAGGLFYRLTPLGTELERLVEAAGQCGKHFLSSRRHRHRLFVTLIGAGGDGRSSRVTRG
jgi:hypothetical protein